MSRRFRFLVVAACAAFFMTGCAAAAANRSAVFDLRTLNDSGVTGTVTLIEIDSQHTRVEVKVDPAGHLDMPAHIHPGTCDVLTPQPKYPLENVVNGSSSTDLPVPMDELLTIQQSLNIHDSNGNMALFTACAQLGGTVIGPTGDPNATMDPNMDMPGMSMPGSGIASPTVRPAPNY